MLATPGLLYACTLPPPTLDPPANLALEPELWMLPEAFEQQLRRELSVAWVTELRDGRRVLLSHEVLETNRETSFTSQTQKQEMYSPLKPKVVLLLLLLLSLFGRV